MPSDGYFIEGQNFKYYFNHNKAAKNFKPSAQRTESTSLILKIFKIVFISLHNPFQTDE
jgi:hypothetical protein